MNYNLSGLEKYFTSQDETGHLRAMVNALKHDV